MPNLIERIATPVLMLCALVVTAVVVRREIAPEKQKVSPVVREVKEWRKFMGGGSMLGQPEAPVVLIEFSDFECPYCAVLSHRVDSLQRKYGDKLTVVYRHFPLDNLHKHARAAARASICADRQGGFEPFYRHLFANQKTMGKLEWTKVAFSLGVRDSVGFNACLGSRVPDESIARDSVAAEELALRGTPLVLLNEYLLAGTPSFKTLDSIASAIIANR